MERIGFDELADREGFAVVYPQAVDRRWNDGRVDPKQPTPADDVAFIRDRVPDDGTTVERTTFGCAPGTDVELLAIEGGGHTWPGGTQYLPERIIGRVSRELDATSRIWQFFAAHHR